MQGERRERVEHNKGSCEGISVSEFESCENDTDVIEGPRMACAQGKVMTFSKLNMTVRRLGSNILAGLYVPREYRTFS